ncbi:MAG: PDGLE domain-containing protein [Peptococcaceae bacterium]|nr:PDGLE domain-containing protein [Peptococcaceae bacterium]
MKNIYKVLLLALIVAAVLSPLASSSPDGLERVAEDLGFLEKGEGAPVIKSPVPDYVFPGIENEAAATAAAGVAGTLATFGAMYLLAKSVKRKNAGEIKGK